MHAQVWAADFCILSLACWWSIFTVSSSWQEKTFSFFTFQQYFCLAWWLSSVTQGWNNEHFQSTIFSPFAQSSCISNFILLTTTTKDLSLYGQLIMLDSLVFLESTGFYQLEKKSRHLWVFPGSWGLCIGYFLLKRAN